MRITDLLDKRSVNLNAAPTSKKEAMDMAVDLMAASGKVKDIEAYRALVYAREEESTTGVGEGIAIPHGKGDCIDKPGLAAMIIKDGVDYEALDDEPVNILFLIAAPDTKDNVHLDVMSKLSMMLMDEDFRANLIGAKDVDEFLAVIDKARTNAAKSVNCIANTAYWEIGKLLYEKKLDSGYGNRVVERLSVDLKQLYPSMGLSPRQLWNMKKFYVRYLDKDEKLLQAVAVLPWSHNLLMLSKNTI